MRKYDFEKARKIILESIDAIDEATFGMHEDWFWTAEPIFRNGEFLEETFKKGIIGGISGSCWATPTLEIEFKDGTKKAIACYTGEKDDERPEWMTLGCLSGPAQEARSGIALEE